MFIPNTAADQQEMLQAIGLSSLDQLFDVIPEAIRLRTPLAIPPAMSEMELTRHVARLAAQNISGQQASCFLGGGCYDHFVPAVVDTIASRSEYYTAYTPYQAEASQGTLQVGFEFQTLIAQLTGLDVSNASLYEGATAVTEAVLMAVRSFPKRTRIVVSESLHPEYRQTLKTYLTNLSVELVEVPLRGGVTDLDAMRKAVDESTACVVVQSPNFFGSLEPVAEWVAAARKVDAIPIQSFDPISLGMLKRPGDFGVDVAVAEGQSLGTPMAFGGPFLGLFACRESFVRRIPGRVVGETLDRNGKRCFVLTLQTREQHIRREKATSNICTNQGLLALRASVYLALAGPQGMREVAELCYQKSHYAASQLATLPGVRIPFADPFFKEFVVELPTDPRPLLPKLLEEGYHAGVPLGTWYPAMERSLLVAVTEKRTKEEIDGLVAAWRKVLS